MKKQKDTLKECPDCKGTGAVMITREDRCFKCKGKGQWEPKPYEQLRREWRIKDFKKAFKRGAVFWGTVLIGAFLFDLQADPPVPYLNRFGVVFIFVIVGMVVQYIMEEIRKE